MPKLRQQRYGKRSPKLVVRMVRFHPLVYAMLKNEAAVAKESIQKRINRILNSYIAGGGPTL